MSSSSGYGSVPAEPVPEDERPAWLRRAGDPAQASSETPTAQYGYSLDKPSAPSAPAAPYASPYPGQQVGAGQQYVRPQPPQQPYPQPPQQPYLQQPQSYQGPGPSHPQHPPQAYPQGQPGYLSGPGAYPPAGYPQPYPGQPVGQWVQEDPYAKSRVVAGLLGIFLGALGIHRFYTGHTGIGVLMLLITVLSLGIFAAVTSIWGLVEGILYLVSKTGSYSRDASGRPLRG